MSRPRNLNRTELRGWDDEPLPLADPSLPATIAGSGVAVHFRDLETRLVALLAGAQAVVGCVAWLTNARILAALAKASVGVSLVVQKEDLFRPDGRGGQKGTLRAAYDRLPSLGLRHRINGQTGKLSNVWSGRSGDGCGEDLDVVLAPVRCAGNYNRDRAPACARMHHKFLVLCDAVRVPPPPPPDLDPYDHNPNEGGRTRLTPHTVWTGSFNLTSNATRSLENAVVLRDPAIAAAYYREWEQVLALSEPLDWTQDWSTPEWWVGT